MTILSESQKERMLIRLREDLAIWGAKLDDSEIVWKGVHAYYIVHCPNGHTFRQVGSNIRRKNKCTKCFHINRTRNAEKQYCIYLSMYGAIPKWTEWKGMRIPHKVICINNHICYPWPMSIISGQGICKICANRDSQTSEIKCKNILSNIGATPLWDIWIGGQYRHKIMCKNGHVCWPKPENIISGQGPCTLCKGIDWDTFYVVHNPTNNIFKFGITNSSNKIRISTHKRQGYTDIIYIVSNIDAITLERNIRDILKLNNISAFKGREYFDDIFLDLVISELYSYNLGNEIINE